MRSIVNLPGTAAIIAIAVNWSYSYKVDVTQCAFAATIRKTAPENLASRGVFCFLIRIHFFSNRAFSSFPFLTGVVKPFVIQLTEFFLRAINPLSATQRCVCINFTVDQELRSHDRIHAHFRPTTNRATSRGGRRACGGGRRQCAVGSRVNASILKTPPAQPSGVSCLSRPESKAGPERVRTGAWRQWAQLPNHNALPARN